jgi:hypothetical protein
MYDAHDATEVRRDRKTVVVHYDGMTESVTVRGGKVVKHTAGAELHCLHAIGEAARALEAMSGLELDGAAQGRGPCTGQTAASGTGVSGTRWGQTSTGVHPTGGYRGRQRWRGGSWRTAG